MKQLAAMVQPEWVKVAKLSLTNKKSKKEYYKFLELLGEVIVNGEVPDGFEETPALKLFESLGILGKLKADWERYEKKCRGKNSQSDSKKTENQETNSGKDKDKDTLTPRGSNEKKTLKILEDYSTIEEV